MGSAGLVVVVGDVSGAGCPTFWSDCAATSVTLAVAPVALVAALAGLLCSADDVFSLWIPAPAVADASLDWEEFPVAEAYSCTAAASSRASTAICLALALESPAVSIVIILICSLIRLSISAAIAFLDWLISWVVLPSRLIACLASLHFFISEANCKFRMSGEVETELSDTGVD